jgi:hypothetical protein
MSLFERLVKASGLSAVFARSSLQRALARIDARPETLSAEQLKAALPDVEKVLRLFLQDVEVQKRLQEIKELARQP